jgi:hypothetical protein
MDVEAAGLEASGGVDESTESKREDLELAVPVPRAGGPS